MVFAQSQSDNNGGLHPRYPATVEETAIKSIRCRCSDPDDEFAKHKDVELVQEISKDRIMEFNLANGNYIELTQIRDSRKYWGKCVAKAKDCADAPEYCKKKKSNIIPIFPKIAIKSITTRTK